MKTTTLIRTLATFVAGVVAATAQADTVSSAHVRAVKEGTPLTLPADFPAQTVELRWVEPEDIPAINNVFNVDASTAASWSTGKANIGSIGSAPNYYGRPFARPELYTATGGKLVSGHNYFYAFHYEVAEGQSFNPSGTTSAPVAYLAPESKTFPLTGSGWCYVVTKNTSANTTVWTSPTGCGTFDRAYAIDLTALGYTDELSVGKFAALFGERDLKPGQSLPAVTRPRNGDGKIVQTLTITNAKGDVRRVVHVVGDDPVTEPLRPGDTLSLDCGTAVFRPVENFATTDWSPYLWYACGDVNSLPAATQDGTVYHDIVRSQTNIRNLLDAIDATGFWTGNTSGMCFSDRVWAVPADADIVTIFGASRDAVSNQSGQCQPGTVTDDLDDPAFDNPKSCTAYFREAIKAVRARAPLAKLVIMSSFSLAGGAHNTKVTAHVANYAQIAAEYPGVRFVNWQTGQCSQGYNIPNEANLDSTVVKGNTAYLGPTSTYIPTAAYQQQWIAPAFTKELGWIIDDLRATEIVPAPDEHVHTLAIVGDETDALSATCTDPECRNPGPYTLSLTGTASKVYDGEPLTVAIEGADDFVDGTDAVLGDIVYRNGDDVLGGAPSAVGNYTATVTVTIGEQEVSLVKVLTITEHVHDWAFAQTSGTALNATCSGEGLCGIEDQTVSLTLTGTFSKEEDGEPLAVTVVGAAAFAAATGATVGDVVYSSGTAPTEIGDYTATVTVTPVEGEAYTLTAALSITHAHVWTFTGDNTAALTAECTAQGCGAPGPFTVSLVGTATKPYDGQPLVVSLDGATAFTAGTGATVGEIAYFDNADRQMAAPPTQGGTYSAKVTVTTPKNGEKTLVLPLEITGHIHAWTFENAGTAITATCTEGGCDIGSVTIALTGESMKFYDEQPLVITVEGGEDFARLTGATVSDLAYKTSSAQNLPGAPSEPGAYYAELVVTPNGGDDITLTKVFNIEERQLYVCLKQGVNGRDTGFDWANAHTNLNEALADAVAKGLPLRVAQGVYIVRETIALPDGFQIFGGYKGEPGDNDRDIDKYQTIFCGDQELNNVWYRFTPNENSASISVSAATAEPLIKDGKFNDPVAALGYNTAYDGFCTKVNGTETTRCFSIDGDVGGTLDGLYIVGFGAKTANDGAAIYWASKPVAARTVALNDLRIYGCMLAGAPIYQQTMSGKLTTEMSGCKLAYSGAVEFNNANAHYLAGYIHSKGFIRNCTFESLVRNASAGNCTAFLCLGQNTTRGATVDVEGCSFVRCATCSGINNYYGGNMGVVGYAAANFCDQSFCDNTFRNCYVGATAAGQYPLVSLSYYAGALFSNTYRGLRFENNLELVKTTDGSVNSMIGVGVGTKEGAAIASAAMMSIEDSVFKGNRIKAVSGEANAAVGIIGGNSTQGLNFTLVNCVFDNNTAESAVEGVALSRGVINPGNDTVHCSFGLANCTFLASEPGKDIVQFGAQNADCNVVNCTFDVADAQTYNPFGVAGGATSTVRLYSCTVKNCLDSGTLGVAACDESFAFDAIPLDADYRPLVRMPQIRETAIVATNAAAYNAGGSAGSYRPVTFSFKPVGKARMPLCAAIKDLANDIGAIDDLYGESRATSNTRGAVQRMADNAESSDYAAVVIRPRDVTIEGGESISDLSTASVSSLAMMVPKGETDEPVELHAVRDASSERVFAGWYREDGTQFSAENPLTLTGIDEDTVLEARFMIRNGAVVLFF